MNKFFIILLVLFLSSPNSFSEGHEESGIAHSASVKIAVVDFQRVLMESSLGKDYIKGAKKNIEKRLMTALGSRITIWKGTGYSNGVLL